MREQLEKKLDCHEPYADKELDWLLDHIGDKSPEIRDNLVYRSWCHMMMNQLVSRNQLQQLYQQVKDGQLQMLGLGSFDQTSLTRSFTSLLNALFLAVDGDQDSPYYQFLGDDERVFLFQQAITYLPQEKDNRGFHPDYGWIHAIAHGADFLLAACCHPDFPLDKIPEVLACLETTFKNQHTTFTAGESNRLAEIPIYLVSHPKLTALITDWLTNFIISGDSPNDYSRQLNVQTFLNTIYLRLKQANNLPTDLEKVLLNHPNLIAY